MKVQILKYEIKVMVRKNDDLKLQLAKTNDIKVGSIDRWLREDDVMLTTVTNLQIIRNHFQLDPAMVLTEEKESQPA